MATEDQYHKEMRERLEAVEKRTGETGKKVEAILKGLAKKSTKKTE